MSQSLSPLLFEGEALIAPIFQDSRVRLGRAEARVTQIVRTCRIEFRNPCRASAVCPEFPWSEQRAHSQK